MAAIAIAKARGLEATAVHSFTAPEARGLKLNGQQGRVPPEALRQEGSRLTPRGCLSACGFFPVFPPRCVFREVVVTRQDLGGPHPMPPIIGSYSFQVSGCSDICPFPCPHKCSPRITVQNWGTSFGHNLAHINQESGSFDQVQKDVGGEAQPGIWP